MAATDTGLTFTYANVPGFCCAKSTTYDDFSIWVSTNGNIFRIDSSDMSIQNTINLSSICPSPTSLLSTDYFAFLGCTNGKTIKIRMYDLSTSDIVASSGINSNLAVTSFVSDGTYIYTSYQGSSNIEITQITVSPWGNNNFNSFNNFSRA